MTALEQYIRLEAAGRWREGPDAPWREVLISFGNASLVLSDFEEQPLTHWSLAAVEIVAREGAAVVYAPDPAAAELLEVSDRDMIEAIAAVSAMARSRSRPGRRRLRGLRLGALGLLLALGVGGAIWGPDLLRARAYALVSPEQAELMSDRLRTRLAPACRSGEGARVLARLADRIAPGTRVEVRRWANPPLTALPDGTLVLSNDVVEQATVPGVVAGWIALGAAAGPAISPLYRWTREVSGQDLLGFLSSGDIGDDGMQRMSTLTTTNGWQPAPETVTQAMARLAELGGNFDAFGAEIAQRYGVTPTAAADALQRAEGAPALIARDRDWVALQDICAS